MDIGESESGESSDYDSEEDDHLDEFEDFLDNNLEMYRKSSVPKSGGTFSYRNANQIQFKIES